MCTAWTFSVHSPAVCSPHPTPPPGLVLLEFVSRSLLLYHFLGPFRASPLKMMSHSSSTLPSSCSLIKALKHVGYGCSTPSKGRRKLVPHLFHVEKSTIDKETNTAALHTHCYCQVLYLFPQQWAPLGGIQDLTCIHTLSIHPHKSNTTKTLKGTPAGLLWGHGFPLLTS